MRRILRLGIILLYVAASLLAFLLIIKPGTSFFYWKQTLTLERIPRNENIFDYLLPNDLKLLDPETVLVIEDGKVLEPASPQYVRSVGSGNFAVINNQDRSITIQFVPSDSLDTLVKDRTYQVFIRPFFFSSVWGGRVFMVLMLVLFGFLAAAWSVPTKRTLLRRSPREVIKNWETFLEPPYTYFPDISSTKIPRSFRFRYSAMNIIWIAFFYTLMEWLFFVTKPSFMDILPVFEKIKIFAFTGLLVSLAALLVLVVIYLVDLLLGSKLPILHTFGYHVPGAILAGSVSLILVDNFTYTVLKFGIVNSTLLMRILYSVGFAGVFTYFLMKFARSILQAWKQSEKRASNYLAGAIFSTVTVLALFNIQLQGIVSPLKSEVFAQANLPNIILFGTDGLNAKSMSVYGYERDTTPFIAELANTSLVSENNFTNSAHSTGSDTSMLTGKLPLETRVLYPPDTLKGLDRYLHLPGILQRIGYRTVSLGVPYFMDADTINFKNAFDAVNCVEKTPSLFYSTLSSAGFEEIHYFFVEIFGRISERLGHIFYIKDMEDLLSGVMNSQVNQFTDQVRLDCLRKNLNESIESGKPLFAHVHLLATHGPKFSPISQVYSKDKEQTEIWMTDFYDDTILNYDQEVENLVNYLIDLNIYENTIIVLYTDHGQRYNTLTRMPLIIRFPQGQYAKRITANTQNLDIAPTLLDYLGIEKPQWMRGSSLLGELDPKRLIYALYGRNIEVNSAGKFALSAKAYRPPFYQFGRLTVIQCQQAYVFNLINMNIEKWEIYQYRNPCPLEELDTDAQIKEAVSNMFVGLGFNLPTDW